jgi:hypothetical protein
MIHALQRAGSREIASWRPIIERALQGFREKSMPNESYAKTLSKLSFRSTAVEAHLEEVPNLRAPWNRLNELLVRAYDLTTRQAALTAAKQEVSKELAEVVTEGREVMAFLDAGLRFHYGRRSEKLVAFGQQPFRGLKRRAQILGPDGRPATPEISSEPQE